MGHTCSKLPCCPPCMEDSQSTNSKHIELDDDAHGKSQEAKLEITTVETNAESTMNSSPIIWMELLDPKSGEMYYYNRLTHESTWERPKDFSLSTKVGATFEEAKGTVNWVEAKTKDGRTYYYDRVTRETRWDRPASLQAKAEKKRLKLFSSIRKKRRPSARKNIFTRKRHSKTSRELSSLAKNASSEHSKENSSVVDNETVTNDGEKLPGLDSYINKNTSNNQEDNADNLQQATTEETRKDQEDFRNETTESATDGVTSLHFESTDKMHDSEQTVNKTLSIATPNLETEERINTEYQQSTFVNDAEKHNDRTLEDGLHKQESSAEIASHDEVQKVTEMDGSSQLQTELEQVEDTNHISVNESVGMDEEDTDLTDTASMEETDVQDVALVESSSNMDDASPSNIDSADTNSKELEGTEEQDPNSGVDESTISLETRDLDEEQVKHSPKSPSFKFKNLSYPLSPNAQEYASRQPSDKFDVGLESKKDEIRELSHELIKVKRSKGRKHKVVSHTNTDAKHDNASSNSNLRTIEP